MSKINLADFDDNPTPKKETDIYELNNTEVMVKPDKNDKDSTFTEVLKFFYDTKTGEAYPKKSSFAVKIYDENDESKYFGELQLIDLSKYINKKD